MKHFIHYGDCLFFFGIKHYPAELYSVLCSVCVSFHNVFTNYYAPSLLLSPSLSMMRRAQRRVRVKRRTTNPPI